jgi:hypothetical protein
MSNKHVLSFLALNVLIGSALLSSSNPVIALGITKPHSNVGIQRFSFTLAEVVVDEKDDRDLQKQFHDAINGGEIEEVKVLLKRGGVQIKKAGNKQTR